MYTLEVNNTYFMFNVLQYFKIFHYMNLNKSFWTLLVFEYYIEKNIYSEYFLCVFLTWDKKHFFRIIKDNLFTIDIMFYAIKVCFLF